MFWKRYNKERMDFIQKFRPTSKAQLLQVAMWYHRGDIEKAQQMVDFYAKNMELPDYDPVPKSWQESTKETVNGLIGWLKENQDTLTQGYQFIRDVVANRTLPPVEMPTATALPPINDA